MAKKNVNDVLVSVMTDLNLTYTTEELLDENLLDYLKGAGRKVANGARDAGFAAGRGIDAAKTAAGNVASTVGAGISGAANAVGNASNAVGNWMETDKGIARSGVLLVKDGKFLGVRGVEKGTGEANDVQRMYQAQGYLPATDPQRAEAATQQFEVIEPDKIIGNFKPATITAANEILAAAQQLSKTVNRDKVVTASTIVNDGSINKILNVANKMTDMIKDSQKNAAPSAPVATSAPIVEPAPVKPAAPAPSTSATAPGVAATAPAGVGVANSGEPVNSSFDVSSETPASSSPNVVPPAPGATTGLANQGLGNVDDGNPATFDQLGKTAPAGSPAATWGNMAPTGKAAFSNQQQTRNESKELTSPLDVFFG
jgi:hypothetical protein